MSRQSENLKIIDLLKKAVLDSPDARFSQIMRNSGLVSERYAGAIGLSDIVWRDEFYLESSKLRKRVEAHLDGKPSVVANLEGEHPSVGEFTDYPDRRPHD